MGLRAPRFDRLTQPAKRLIVISFVVDVGAACTLLAVQFKGIKLGASPATLGTLFAANFLIYMVVCVISGHLSDRVGRRFMTVVAAAVCLIAWYGMALVQSVTGLLLLAVLSGAGLALIWPPIEAWLADLSGNSARLLNRNIGLFNIAWTGGLMVGPLLAGQLWDSYGEGVFVVAGSTALFCLLVAIFTPTAPPADAHVAPPAHVDTALVTRFLYMAWLALVGCAFTRGMVGGCFPNLGESLHFSKALVGKLQFMMAAGQFVAFIVTRTTQAWQYRLPPLWVSIIVSVAAMLAALVSNNAVIFGISFTIIGAALGVTYMAGITYALSSSPEGRGKRVGFHEAIMGIGLVSGSFFGGLTAEQFSLHAPFGLAALILALGGIGQIVVWRMRKAKQSSSA